MQARGRRVSDSQLDPRSEETDTREAVHPGTLALRDSPPLRSTGTCRRMITCRIEFTRRRRALMGV